MAVLASRAVGRVRAARARPASWSGVRRLCSSSAAWRRCARRPARGEGAFKARDRALTDYDEFPFGSRSPSLRLGESADAEFTSRYAMKNEHHAPRPRRSDAAKLDRINGVHRTRASSSRRCGRSSLEPLGSYSGWRRDLRGIACRSLSRFPLVVHMRTRNRPAALRYTSIARSGGRSGEKRGRRARVCCRGCEQRRARQQRRCSGKLIFAANGMTIGVREAQLRGVAGSRGRMRRPCRRVVLQDLRHWVRHVALLLIEGPFEEVECVAPGSEIQGLLGREVGREVDSGLAPHRRGCGPGHAARRQPSRRIHQSQPDGGDARPRLPADDRRGPIADGFGVHVPKGYIYSAMAFSAVVEMLNIWARRRRERREAAA